MPLGDAIYLGLRAADFGLSILAAVLGILYAFKVRLDPVRAGLVFAASLVVLGGGTLSLFNAALHFRARYDSPIPSEDWLWLVFDATLPVLLIFLLRVSRRRDVLETQRRRCRLPTY